MNKICNLPENQDFSFSEIKGLIKELSKFNESEIKSLSFINNELLQRVVVCCSYMFMLRKSQNKNYSSFGVPELKSIIIDDDNELVSESDQLKIAGFFTDNIEYFYRLVAECFVQKKETDNCNNHIFYGHFKSPFNADFIDIYLVKKDNCFFVIKNDCYDIELLSYLSHYGIKNIEDLYSNVGNTINNEPHSHFKIQESLVAFFHKVDIEIKNNIVFQEGAITFLDFLGWKGLWQKDDTAPLGKVAKLIETFRLKLAEISKQYYSEDDNIKTICSLISISDTIAIFTPHIPGLSEIDLLSIHTETAKYILETSCKSGYAIRGAITYGEYSIKDNIMIGPGIDECASWHEKCDWIGVHIAPTAQFMIDQSNTPKNVVSYGNIPVKKGVPKVKHCVDWKISNDEFNFLRKKSKAILPEIAAKYINTYEFLFGREEKNSG